MHISKKKKIYTQFNAFFNNIPIVHVAFIFIDGGNWKYHGKVVSYISPQNGIALTTFISDTLMVISEYQHFISDTLVVISVYQHFISDTLMVISEYQHFISDTLMVISEYQHSHFQQH